MSYISSIHIHIIWGIRKKKSEYILKKLYQYKIYGYIDVYCVCSLLPVSGSGRGVQHYVVKFVRDLRQVGGFL
jgi:hypothetical protein